MSDRNALAREIAARTKPRFIDTNPKRPQTLEECKALARKIAAAKPPRFILDSHASDPARYRSPRSSLQPCGAGSRAVTTEGDP